MARPRVFISSTFYDLKHVRADIERFVSELGYDAVANERGHIPYGSQEALEEYCYKEVGMTDIVVSIIGGRFGSSSSQGGSISQVELKTAVKLSKQIYIFIDSDVHSELRTYKFNKDNEGVKYAHVDNVKIFEFIEEIEALKINNAIFSFKESSEIIEILREQFAGIFQQLLRVQSRQEEVRLVESLKSTSQSLEDVVKFLKTQNKKDGDLMAEILLPSHPLFSALAETLDVRHRIYFQNLEELDRYLKSLNFEDDIILTSSENVAWERARHVAVRVGGKTEPRMRIEELSVSRSLFSEQGDLKPMTQSAWSNDYIVFGRRLAKIEPDDIPF